MKQLLLFIFLAINGVIFAQQDDYLLQMLNEKDSLMVDEEIEAYPIKMYFCLHKTQAYNINGWQLSYMGYDIKDNQKIILSKHITVEALNITSFYKYKHGITTAKLRYISPGAGLLIPLSPSTHLSASLQVPMGTEIINENKDLILGVYSFQGFIFTSKYKPLTAGIGVFERYLTSDIIKLDMGVNIFVGVTF